MDTKELIEQGKAVLGIEFGSTRIKAVLIDEDNKPIAGGNHDWENRFENGIWTYSLSDITEGLRDCYSELKKDVMQKYNTGITKFAAIGISGMMHGYMAFDKQGELLVPFRTWRNTMTGEASGILTDKFGFHIPQRWSIAHLYQAVLNKEPHVEDISFMTTLAGYIHWKLTGRKVVGIGEASGIFPIDSETGTYNKTMMEKFNSLTEEYGFDWKIRDILPEVLIAGTEGGRLTGEGAAFLDPSGELESGALVCPPEGDAGTGMTATNSVRIRTGNVSAGTSVFAMVVLEKELQKVHEELDLVTTPDGKAVAMVHCNNCTSDINAWMKLFKEFADSLGVKLKTDELYTMMFKKALEGDYDGGGLLSYNYFSGEHITGFEEGRPLFVRTPDSKFNLANFMRVHLFTALGALKVGLDILLKEEGVKLDCIYGHGGFFKTPVVGQKILAAAIDAPVSVMKTAGEGGAWGIALLASYMINKKEKESLGDFLDRAVFCGDTGEKVNPDKEDVVGFNEFIRRYVNGFEVEAAAVKSI